VSFKTPGNGTTGTVSLPIVLKIRARYGAGTGIFRLRGKQGHLVPERFLFARMSAVALGYRVDPVKEGLLIDGTVLILFHDQIKRLQKIFFKPSRCDIHDSFTFPSDVIRLQELQDTPSAHKIASTKKIGRLTSVVPVNKWKTPYQARNCQRPGKTG
jgi:hypothetical protein